MKKKRGNSRITFLNHRGAKETDSQIFILDLLSLKLTSSFQHFVNLSKCLTLNFSFQHFVCFSPTSGLKTGQLNKKLKIPPSPHYVADQPIWLQYLCALQFLSQMKLDIYKTFRIPSVWSFNVIYDVRYDLIFLDSSQEPSLSSKYELPKDVRFLNSDHAREPKFGNTWYQRRLNPPST